ncbi:hypothetical protein EMPG_13105, partial [Blastomyces silverae]
VLRIFYRRSLSITVSVEPGKATISWREMPIKPVLLMKSHGQREMELLRGGQQVVPKLHGRLAVIKGKRGQNSAMLQKPSKKQRYQLCRTKVVERKRRRG